MWHALKRREIIQGSFRKTPKRRDDLEDSRRREDTVKMDFKVWEYVDWIYLDQDRNKWRGVVNAGMKLRFPYVSFQEFFH